MLVRGKSSPSSQIYFGAQAPIGKNRQVCLISDKEAK